MPRNNLRIAELAQYFAGKWQQCNVAGAFDRGRQLTLVFRACASLAARADFAIIRYKPLQKIVVFVINFQILICAKLTFSRA